MCHMGPPHIAGQAFLHWYTGEGMDVSEMAEAEENLTGALALLLLACCVQLKPKQLVK